MSTRRRVGRPATGSRCGWSESFICSLFFFSPALRLLLQILFVKANNRQAARRARNTPRGLQRDTPVRLVLHTHLDTRGHNMSLSFHGSPSKHTTHAGTISQMCGTQAHKKQSTTYKALQTPPRAPVRYGAASSRQPKAPRSPPHTLPSSGAPALAPPPPPTCPAAGASPAPHLAPSDTPP